jgi:phosphoenolpyruvate-protein kinase (PTS system EI component)
MGLDEFLMSAISIHALRRLSNTNFEDAKGIAERSCSTDTTDELMTLLTSSLKKNNLLIHEMRPIYCLGEDHGFVR